MDDYDYSSWDTDQGDIYLGFADNGEYDGLVGIEDIGKPEIDATKEMVSDIAENLRDNARERKSLDDAYRRLQEMVGTFGYITDANDPVLDTFSNGRFPSPADRIEIADNSKMIKAVMDEFGKGTVPIHDPSEVHADGSLGEFDNEKEAVDFIMRLKRRNEKLARVPFSLRTPRTFIDAILRWIVDKIIRVLPFSHYADKYRETLKEVKMRTDLEAARHKANVQHEKVKAKVKESVNIDKNIEAGKKYEVVSEIEPKLNMDELKKQDPDLSKLQNRYFQNNMRGQLDFEKYSRHEFEEMLKSEAYSRIKGDKKKNFDKNMKPGPERDKELLKLGYELIKPDGPEDMKTIVFKRNLYQDAMALAYYNAMKYSKNSTIEMHSFPRSLMSLTYRIDGQVNPYMDKELINKMVKMRVNFIEEAEKAKGKDITKEYHDMLMKKELVSFIRDCPAALKFVDKNIQDIFVKSEIEISKRDNDLGSEYKLGNISKEEFNKKHQRHCLINVYNLMNQNSKGFDKELGYNMRDGMKISNTLKALHDGGRDDLVNVITDQIEHIYPSTIDENGHIVRHLPNGVFHIPGEKPSKAEIAVHNKAKMLEKELGFDTNVVAVSFGERINEQGKDNEPLIPEPILPPEPIMPEPVIMPADGNEDRLTQMRRMLVFHNYYGGTYRHLPDEMSDGQIPDQDPSVQNDEAETIHTEENERDDTVDSIGGMLESFKEEYPEIVPAEREDKNQERCFAVKTEEAAIYGIIGLSIVRSVNGFSVIDSNTKQPVPENDLKVMISRIDSLDGQIMNKNKKAKVNFIAAFNKNKNSYDLVGFQDKNGEIEKKIYRIDDVKRREPAAVLDINNSMLNGYDTSSPDLSKAVYHISIGKKSIDAGSRLDFKEICEQALGVPARDVPVIQQEESQNFDDAVQDEVHSIPDFSPSADEPEYDPNIYDNDGQEI